MSGDTQTKDPIHFSEMFGAIPREKIPLLPASFASESKQDKANQAHAAIATLNLHFKKSRYLATFATLMVRSDRAQNPPSAADPIRGRAGLKPEFQDDVMRMVHTESLLELDRVVDQCLFGGRAMDDDFASSFNRDVANHCKRFNADVEGLGDSVLSHYQGRASEEFKAMMTECTKQNFNRKGDTQHADVPSLATSYDTATNGEIRDKTRGAIQALDDLLSRAKALALAALPHFGCRDTPERVEWAIRDLLDIAGDLALLRGYVDKLVRTRTVMARSVLRQRAITSFMARKFDRATSRLADRLKSRIQFLEELSGSDDDDARPCSAGESQDLTTTIRQGEEDNEAFLSLLWRARALMDALEDQGNRGAEDVIDGIDFGAPTGHCAAFVMLAVKVNGDIQHRNGVLVDSLGRDFVAKVLEAAHGLIKADITTFKRHNSKLEKGLGLTSAEAAARFPAVSSTQGILDYMRQHKARQE